jgi:nanoRNase/pAp phosphatase (c-di-AMP/oligoRNAs hydrolase)
LDFDKSQYAGRVRDFSKIIKELNGTLLVLGHNYPDPDCLGAAVGIKQVIEHVNSDLKIELAFGGVLGRAENRAMAGILDIEFEEVGTIDAAKYCGVVTVDCQPNAGNLTLPEGVEIVGVVDHHESPEQEYEADFVDIRINYGASCTIICEYFDELGIEFDTRLSTALYLGIRTDTEDLERDGTEADTAAYVRLFPHVDRSKVIAIMRPPLSEEYFSLLRQALNVARRWGDTVVANLGEVHARDLLAEVAELFARMKGTNLSLAVGVFNGDVHFSIRSSKGTRKLLDIAKCVAGKNGSAGGHGRAVGGLVKGKSEDADKIAETFCQDFISILELEDQGPRPVCIGLPEKLQSGESKIDL